MMKCSDFDRAYWAQYISLEKEYAKTSEYVTLSTDNYNTFSNAYLKLLLQIGSEVDITMKFYCELLDNSFNGENISKYLKTISSFEPLFYAQEVLVSNTGIILKPWNNPNTAGDQQSPEWWTAYNKCKHNRLEIGTIGSETKKYLQFANLNYTINALAGLYQILVFAYKILADRENKTIKTPLPGSRLFKLDGTLWSGIGFYHDMAFYIDDDGNLIQATGTIIY